MLSRFVKRGVPTMARLAATQIPARSFQGHLGLDSTKDLLPMDFKKENQVAFWKDVNTHANDDALVLKTNDEIEEYVLSMVKSYFRTTKKASVSLDAPFKDHGLDSLDVIELVIQVEDELGYMIDAEKLELFSKPRHFVNYISQMESYRTEFGRDPTDGIHADFSKDALFPGLPKLGH